MPDGVSPGDLIPLILAGGLGTRIAHLHPGLPKPAVPVAGRPFLAWILGQLCEAGFTRAVVSSGHLAQRLCDEISPWVPDSMEIRWIPEDAPLGTGGGAAHAARDSGFCPKAWLLLNGDSWLAGNWIPELLTVPAGDMAIIAREVDDTSRYGHLVSEGGKLVRFAEKKGTGPGLINAGIYRIPADWMAGIPSTGPSSLESDWIPRWLVERRSVRLVRWEGEFLDIGTPDSLRDAGSFMLKHGPTR